jgi:hypothetical protein
VDVALVELVAPTKGHAQRVMASGMVGVELVAAAQRRHGTVQVTELDTGDAE